MGMIAQVQDPMLRQVIGRVEATLKPEYRKNYEQIVTAGMKLIWSQQFDQERESYLGRINGIEAVPALVAHGIVKVFSIIQNESNTGQMQPAAVPASITLMAQVLEYIEKKMRLRMTEDVIAKTTALVKDGIFSLYKITPDVIEQVRQRSGQAAQPSTVQPAETDDEEAEGPAEEEDDEEEAA